MVVDHMVLDQMVLDQLSLDQTVLHLSAHIKFIEMCLMEVVDGQVVPQRWKEISSVCGNFVFSPDASFIEMFHLGLEFIHNEIEVILYFVDSVYNHKLNYFLLRM